MIEISNEQRREIKKKIYATSEVYENNLELNIDLEDLFTRIIENNRPELGIKLEPPRVTINSVERLLYYVTQDNDDVSERNNTKDRLYQLARLADEGIIPTGDIFNDYISDEDDSYDYLDEDMEGSYDNIFIEPEELYESKEDNNQRISVDIEYEDEDLDHDVLRQINNLATSLEYVEDSYTAYMDTVIDFYKTYYPSLYNIYIAEINDIINTTLNNSEDIILNDNKKKNLTRD